MITTRRNGMVLTPWGDVDALRREMNGLFGSLVPARAEDGSWAPPVNVREDADAIRVELELPGVNPHDVDITIQDQVLTIAGEKRGERRDEQGSYRLIERRYGRFARSFRLGRDIDADHVDATYEHGVLVVRLPKLEEAKPRRIRIGVGDGRQIESASDQSA